MVSSSGEKPISRLAPEYTARMMPMLTIASGRLESGGSQDLMISALATAKRLAVIGFTKLQL
jgi:hypothetical protein